MARTQQVSLSDIRDVDKSELIQSRIDTLLDGYSPFDEVLNSKSDRLPSTTEVERLTTLLMVDIESILPDKKAIAQFLQFLCSDELVHISSVGNLATTHAMI